MLIFKLKKEYFLKVISRKENDTFLDTTHNLMGNWKSNDWFSKLYILQFVGFHVRNDFVCLPISGNSFEKLLKVLLNVK